MSTDERPFLSRFLFPRFTWKYFLRLALVIGAAFLFFRYLCNPFFIDGASMCPTYPASGFLFSWNAAYWFREPQTGEVVIAHINGKTSYLKRVVAVEGDRVAWKNGRLVRNGVEVDEPYVVYPCDWDSDEEVTVEPGYCYVVGDNRSMPRRNHNHGQISAKRIIGVPLW